MVDPDNADGDLDNAQKELVHVAISNELHARASAICVMRKCTLEDVIEDLIRRYLPHPPAEVAELRQMSAGLVPTQDAKRRTMAWLRRTLA